MTIKTGRCLCGAVTFEADGVEPAAHACHCGMCRRWSGAMGFGLAADEVRFQGEENIGLYKSSDWAERGFCKQCGTNLFYRLKANGQTILWLGTFDDISDMSMGSEIFIDAKPAFYDIAGDHPRLTEQEFMKKIGMG